MHQHAIPICNLIHPVFSCTYTINYLLISISRNYSSNWNIICINRYLQYYFYYFPFIIYKFFYFFLIKFYRQIRYNFVFIFPSLLNLIFISFIVPGRIDTCTSCKYTSILSFLNANPSATKDVYIQS